MPRDWLSIIAAGLCISLVPACTPLLRQTPPSELSALPTAKRPEPPDTPGAGVTARAGTIDPAVQLAADKEMLIEPVRSLATVTRTDLIPVPRSLTESPAAVTVVSSPEQGADSGSPPEARAEPAEEPPVLQALRFYLAGKPAEALAWLGRYDKSSQDLLLCLLPLTVRVTEGDWERCDSREASAILKQMDRVADRVSASLRPRAKLSIKKMCFCSVIEGYGKYLPRSDAKDFFPGEWAKIYVELENLRDQQRGNAAYSIHLISTIHVHDFKDKNWLRHLFHDGPDVSQSERHDFYRWYDFQVPDLPPGFYTLDLTIIDEPTGRKVCRSLDFRVTSAQPKGHW